MAIKSEDLYLSIPNASPIFSKLAISSQFKVSLDLVRRSASGDNLGLFDYLSNCGLFEGGYVKDVSIRLKESGWLG